MQTGRKRQSGFMMMVVIVAIMMLALTALVNMTGDLVAGAGRRVSVTEATLARIQNALVGFASTYQRLPCPAKGSGATNPGWPDDTNALAAITTCAFGDGVVPWNALGLSQAEVTDEWGRVISYRVYDGATGLTQDKGSSAVNCDTDNSGSPNVEPTVAGLCDNAGGLHDTLRSHFITYTTFGTTPSFDKGLNVRDFAATNTPNVAYVLVSHGPSGLGGYMPNGTRMAMPASDAGDYNNTQASPSFFIRQASSNAGIAYGATGHYDDIVSYLKIADLLTLAKQDARDWSEEKTPSFNLVTTANMTSASTDAAAPHFMSTGGGIAGQSFTPDATGTEIGAGLAAGSYSICTWWPSKLTLVSGTTRKALATYVEFAPTDSTGDSFPGLTMGFLAGTSSVSTTGSGSTGATTITVGSSSGILTGMTVRGTGVATGATVTGISGSTISLSPVNTAIVSGTITFGGPTNTTCGTNLAATVTATGTAGNNVLTVTAGSTASIAEGMNVFGDGIPFNATVLVGGITGSGVGATIQLSQNMLNAVSGSVNFATSRQIRRDLGWAGGTLASYTNRFAVEFDASRDIGTAGPPVVASAVDPVRPHLAIDRGGVTHGTDAASCAATGPGLECDSEVNNFLPVSRTASGSSGLNTITITDTAGMYGIVHGMTATDSGGAIPASTTVTAIAGSVVTLSNALTGSPATVTFSSLSTSNLMQNGLTVFHGARVEAYPKDCFGPTATGLIAGSTVTVTDASQIQTGMMVYGSGIGVGATVGSTFTVNLTTPNDSGFSGPVTFAGSGSTITVNATGLVGQSSITVASVAGIVTGMTVSGGSVGAGAAVSDVLVNLSAANSGTVTSSIIFAGATAISTTGTGTSGSTSVTVGSTTGIAAGMAAVGTGLGTGAKVVSINATTLVVVLSVANSGAVSGTLKFLPEKTLVKGWTLSNSGCNLDSALCSAMKNVNAKLTYAGSSGVSTSATGTSGVADILVTSASGIALGMAVSGTGIATGSYVTGISGTTITLSAANTGAVSGIASFDNRQMLHTVSCIPAATVVDAYDSLYFGLTTANRTTSAAVSSVGSGSSGSNQITVTSTTGILVGMAVRGVGIGNGATVSSIDSSTTLTLSTSNLGAVSGTVSFAGAANVKLRALNTGMISLP
jgi:hypothetical protein